MITSSRVPVSEIELSRMDAEYYRPDLIKISKAIFNGPNVSIEGSGAQIDCSAFYPSIVPSYNFKREGIPFLRVNEIQDGLISIDEKTAFLPKSILDENRSTIALCHPGDLVIAKGGNSLGKVALLTKQYPIYSVCRDVLVVRTQALSKINRFYLWMYLHSATGQKLLIRTASQTGQPHLTIDAVAKLRVPLVSSSEQDAVHSDYLAAEAAAELSRIAYTKAHCCLEDELRLDEFNHERPMGYTSNFSELELSLRSDAQHYQPRFTQLVAHISKFPTRRVREIRRVNRRGIQPIYVEGGTHAVVNSQHLGPKHINYDGLERTTEKLFYATPEAHIRKDDLLIYTTGAYIGRTNVYLDDTPAFASNHVNILRLSPDIDHAYMAMVFQSIIGQFQTQKHARGSAQAELYPSDIDKFIVPLLPIEKQQEIGNLVRESLTQQRESARLLEQAKARVEKLIEEAVAA